MTRKQDEPNGKTEEQESSEAAPETVTIPRKEYQILKLKAEMIDCMSLANKANARLGTAQQELNQLEING